MDATALQSIIATLPDYIRDDADVIGALTRIDYDAMMAQIRMYEHPEDKDTLTRAWNAVARTQYRPVTRRCRDCGAPGSVDSRGLGISCGCAAE